MNCPHCGIAFHDEWNSIGISSNNEERTAWTASVTKCPICKHETIRLLKRKSPPGDAQPHLLLDFVAYPRSTQRKSTPPEIPDAIREDYEEACMVLADSNKASAALSRRCLQAILRSQGYTQKDLAQQIDALLGEQDPAKAIPTALRETVNVIRNFGNFSLIRLRIRPLSKLLMLNLVKPSGVWRYYKICLTTITSNRRRLGPARPRSTQS